VRSGHRIGYTASISALYQRVDSCWLREAYEPALRTDRRKIRMRVLGRLSVRRVATAVGLAAALSVAGGTAATPATAGTNCEGGHHCVFYTDFSSARHRYFNSDNDFGDDIFDRGGQFGRGQVVTNNVWSASNSSSGGYYSFYYYSPNRFGGIVFCVEPGSQVSADQLESIGVPGDGLGERDEASSSNCGTPDGFHPPASRTRPGAGRARRVPRGARRHGRVPAAGGSGPPAGG
jgi:hypothetical protein